METCAIASVKTIMPPTGYKTSLTCYDGYLCSNPIGTYTQQGCSDTPTMTFTFTDSFSSPFPPTSLTNIGNDVTFSIIPSVADIGYHTIDITALISGANPYTDSSVQFTIEVLNKCDHSLQITTPSIEDVTYAIENSLQ